MTIVLLAVGAGFVVLALALVALLTARRARRAADKRVEEAVAELNTRMEAIVRDLTDALERAEADVHRSRLFGEVGGSLDLDDVLARTLETAAEAARADAALLSLPDAADGRPLVATLGLSVVEAEREGLIAGPPDGSDVRSIAIRYRYDPAQLDADGGLIHGGLAIPLVVAGDRVGQLTVFTRSPGRTFDEAELEELEELALRAGPAVANARLFRDARRLADLDALTGLHNRRYFHETLEREVARAQRYGRQLALVVLDLDDFKAINDRIGHLAGDNVLADAAERVRDVVRASDVACRVGGDEFAVIMPESTLAEAALLYQRVRAVVATRPITQGATLVFSAGGAELKPQDDASTFFERADEALYRAKRSGKGQLAAASSA